MEQNQNVPTLSRNIHIFDLPQELLEIIFSQVPSAHLRKLFSVSKQWHELTNLYAYRSLVIDLIPWIDCVYDHQPLFPPQIFSGKDGGSGDSKRVKALRNPYEFLSRASDDAAEYVADYLDESSSDESPQRVEYYKGPSTGSRKYRFFENRGARVPKVLLDHFQLHGRELTLLTPAFVWFDGPEEGSKKLRTRCYSKALDIIDNIIPGIRKLEKVTIVRGGADIRPENTRPRHKKTVGDMSVTPVADSLDLCFFESTFDVYNLVYRLNSKVVLKELCIDLRTKDIFDMEKLMTDMRDGNCWCAPLGRIMADVEVFHLRLPVICAHLFDFIGDVPTSNADGSINGISSTKLQSKFGTGRTGRNKLTKKLLTRQIGDHMSGSRLRDVVINTSMGFDEGKVMYLARHCSWYDDPTCTSRYPDLQSTIETSLPSLPLLERLRVVYHKSFTSDLDTLTDKMYSWDAKTRKTYQVSSEAWTSDGRPINTPDETDVIFQEHEVSVENTDFIDGFESDASVDFESDNDVDGDFDYEFEGGDDDVYDGDDNDA